MTTSLIIVGCLYLAPSFLAVVRHTTGAGGVFVVNLLLGWTVIGWIVALAWAAGGAVEPRQKRPT